jgi:hypothetical protein
MRALCGKRCQGCLFGVGNAVGDGGVWMAVHAIEPDMVFDCCYSKLFLARDFPVELMPDSFDACTSLSFVLSGG